MVQPIEERSPGRHRALRRRSPSSGRAKHDLGHDDRDGVERRRAARTTTRSTRIRTNSQPSARAIGTRVAKPKMASPTVSPNVLPATPMTWTRAKNNAAATIPRRTPRRADPRGRREAAEQHLLAEGRDDRPSEQLEREPGVLAGRWQRALGRHAEQGDEDRRDRIPDTAISGTAHSAPPPISANARRVQPAKAHLGPGERPGIDDQQTKESEVHDGQDDQERETADRPPRLEADEPRDDSRCPHWRGMRSGSRPRTRGSVTAPGRASDRPRDARCPASRRRRSTRSRAASCRRRASRWWPRGRRRGRR